MVFCLGICWFHICITLLRLWSDRRTNGRVPEMAREMNMAATTQTADNPGVQTPRRVRRPLRVRPALDRFDESLRRRLRPKVAAPTLHAVRSLLTRLSDAEDVDCVSTFENIVNQCLDLGYRGEALVAFIYEVLRDRFAARVYRRLNRSVVAQAPRRSKILSASRRRLFKS